jgi:sulfonate transport system permease protein
LSDATSSTVIMTAIETNIAEERARTAAADKILPQRRLASRLLLGLVLPVMLALAWEAAVRLGFVQGRLMPPPSRVLATLYALAFHSEPSLWQHILVTTARVAAGFALGVAAATLIGALAGASKLARDLVDPTLQGLRAVPSIAWVPLFILWFGIFEKSKIILIAAGCFFPVYLGMLGAILSVDRKTVEVGRIFRLSTPALVRRILLPAILPAYVVSLRAGLGLGWMFVIAAEFMGASEGLGYLLIDGQQLGNAEEILAAILTFAVLGKLTDGLLVAAAAPFLTWQDAFAPRG